MTAAVARPPLFTHLVASKPSRQEGSFAATATSVAVHATLIVAALVLSARVRTPAVTKEPTTVILPNPIDTPVEPAPAPAKRAEPARPIDPVKTEVAVPMPMPPDVIPSIIPAPSRTVERIGIVPITRRQPSSGDWVSNPGPGAGEPGEFVPLTKNPELLNRAEVARMLQRFYPTSLLQAGIGGEVIVWLRIDTAGSVVQTQVKTPSNYKDFDQAALRVAKVMRFSPAYNQLEKVMVWVQLPIRFDTK
jgi:protein TonB